LKSFSTPDRLTDRSFYYAKHWDDILRWFKSKSNKGLLEAMGSLIQDAKARARGYYTTKNLIAMLHLIAGKLEFNLPT
jgi:transposase